MNTKKINEFEVYNQARKEESASFQEYMRPVMESLVVDGLSTYSMALYTLNLPFPGIVWRAGTQQILPFMPGDQYLQFLELAGIQ